MTEATVRRRRRIELALPGYAYRVRLVLNGHGALNPLDAALLRLIRMRTRTTVELAAILGFTAPHEVFLMAALASLEDRQLIGRTETPDVWRSITTPDGEISGQVTTGWAFFSCATESVLPRIWLSGKLPKQGPDSAVQAPQSPGVRDYPAAPPIGRIASLVARLPLMTNDLRICRPSESGVHSKAGATEAAAPEPFGILKANLASIALEDRVAKRRNNGRQVQLVAQVEMMPTLGAEPVVYVHEPDLFPVGLPTTRVSGSLYRWVETHFPEGYRHVRGCCQELAEDLSELLRSLGITDVEGGKAAARRHFLNTAERFGVPVPPALSATAFREAIEKAQLWMVLAPRAPDLRADAQNCYAKAIELFLQTLFQRSQPSIQRFLQRNWLSQSKRQRKDRMAAFIGNRQRVIDCLVARNLFERLGPTQQHLESALNYGGWYNRFLNENLGAGLYLLLWVWPLVIDDPSDPYPDQLAREIDSALQKEPGLFRLLSDLINTRNRIAHSRTPTAPAVFVDAPEDIDERLMRVWGAIEHGLAVARYNAP